MKNNEINGEINIKEDDIYKNIRIINSYEQVKRDHNNIEDKQYGNEKQIKENIEIKINNQIIPFSYFYKFKKDGIYKINYSFKNYLTNTECMFYKCSSL